MRRRMRYWCCIYCLNNSDNIWELTFVIIASYYNGNPCSRRIMKSSLLTGQLAMNSLSAVPFSIGVYAMTVCPSFLVDWSCNFNYMSLALDWLPKSLLREFHISKHVSVLVRRVCTSSKMVEQTQPRRAWSKRHHSKKSRLMLTFGFVESHAICSVINSGAVLISPITKPSRLLPMIGGRICNFHIFYWYFQNISILLTFDISIIPIFSSLLSSF